LRGFVLKPIQRESLFLDAFADDDGEGFNLAAILRRVELAGRLPNVAGFEVEKSECRDD
jgi:hypothetical protein